MRIVGIDPSLTATAVVMGHGDNEVLSEVFGASSIGNNVHERMARYERLVNCVYSFVNDLNPDLIVLEDYITARSAKVTQALAEFGGILRWHLTSICTDRRSLLEVHPSTLKAAYDAAGKGKGKAVLAATMAIKFGAQFDTEDCYDAYALYQLGCVIAEQRKPITTKEADAARKVWSDNG